MGRALLFLSKALDATKGKKFGQWPTGKRILGATNICFRHSFRALIRCYSARTYADRIAMVFVTVQHGAPDRRGIAAHLSRYRSPRR